MNTLSKTEQKEEMFVTFGRIITSVRLTKDKRLIALVKKFNNDLKKAKVEPNYKFYTK